MFLLAGVSEHKLVELARLEREVVGNELEFAVRSPEPAS